MSTLRKRTPQATVIGPAEASPEWCESAEKVGAMLARFGLTVITGGKGGIMEAACRGARQGGGTTVGIISSTEINDANQWCSIVIPTGLGHARNVLVALAGDFLIVIGISAGTLSEVCFAWQHGKTVLALKGCDNWFDKLSDVHLDGGYACTITECENLDELENAVIDTCRRLNIPVQR